MKKICFGLALMLAGTTASFAANAWKEGDVGGHKIYTDAHGMTLYTYDKDAKGVSNCNGACASNWHPLKASASAKDEGGWTVIKRKDGSHMWAFDGKPLYTYVKDKKAGDAKGDGVGSVWHTANAI